MNNSKDSEKSGQRDRREKVFHIDDNPSGQESSVNLERMMEKSSDPVCCMTASEKTLVIARESGSLQRYSLPLLALINKHSLPSRPHHIAVNCNSSLLSVIDVTGLLQFVDLGKFYKLFNIENSDLVLQMVPEGAMKVMF